MFVWGKVKNEIMDNEKSKTEKIYLFIVCGISVFREVRKMKLREIN